MTQILVSNPTPYPRRETILFGCPMGVQDGDPLHVCPAGQIRTATVEVGPFASGYQDLEPVPPLTVPGGMPDPKMTFWENGKPYAFALEEVLAENNQTTVSVYRATATKSTGRIIVYQGEGEPWFRYSFLPTIESLTVKQTELALGYEIDSGPGGVTYDRLRGTDTKAWVDVKAGDGDPDGLLRDGTGLASEGVHVQGYQVAAAEDPAMLSTAVALTVWDPTTAGDWRAAWGPWNTVPHGVHPDRRNSFGLRDHLGVILNKRPGDTGEQPGFGLWKHLDVIEKGNGHLLDHDRWAVMHEANRPIWWLNADGSWPTKAGHPKFKSWSEKAHWHHGVSPDQFRRIYADGAFYVGWLGMDEEHIACSYLKEDFLLRGSFLSLLILRQKAFLLKTQGRWPGVGRALGRIGMAAWDCYMATGDTELLADMKARFVPTIKATFADVNKVTLADVAAKAPAFFDRPYALRLIQDDPHTGIIGDGWYCWEDGIAVAGLDKLAELFNDPELKMIAYLIGGSICTYGLDASDKILKAIKWNGPGQQPGPKTASSRETNYHDWAYGAWAITARIALEFGDQPMATKAAKLGEMVKQGNYGNRDSYLAPAP